MRVRPPLLELLKMEFWSFWKSPREKHHFCRSASCALRAGDKGKKLFSRHRKMSPPSFVSFESFASAFFVQKKHSSTPVRTLYFPSNDDDEEEEQEQDGEREEHDGEDRERREQRRRLVEVACKGNFCFPEGELRDSSREKSSSLSSCYYTFGLTDQDGKRHFGFVLRWRRGSTSEENKNSNGTTSNEQEGEHQEKEEIAMCVLSTRRF